MHSPASLRQRLHIGKCGFRAQKIAIEQKAAFQSMPLNIASAQIGGFMKTPGFLSSAAFIATSAALIFVSCADHSIDEDRLFGGDPSSSSISASSSSAPADLVFCQVGPTCSAMSAEACAVFIGKGLGQLVAECPAGVSSSSVAGGSSGSTADSLISCQLSTPAICSLMLNSLCSEVGGSVVAACPAKSSSSAATQSSSSSVFSSSSKQSSSSAASSSSQSSSSYQTETIYGANVEWKGEIYKTVIIGSQTWFARNLNYETGNSVCYDNNPANCEIYGRLYTWSAAMDLDAMYDTTEWLGTLPRQGICPNGWHIPSKGEFEQLEKYVANYSSSSATIWVSPDTIASQKRAGYNKLKSREGWHDSEGKVDEHGTDVYGFSALPAGAMHSEVLLAESPDLDPDLSQYMPLYLGSQSFFRSSSEVIRDIPTKMGANMLSLSGNSGSISSWPRLMRISIRCLKD